jgi:hypothetical protein
MCISVIVPWGMWMEMVGLGQGRRIRNADV